RQPVARTSLPDQHPHLAPRDDLRELDVRALRKGRMTLGLRSERVDVDLRKIGDDDDAVRVPQRHRGHRDPPAIDLDRLERVEACLPHIDGDLRDSSVLAFERAGDATAKRVEREALFVGVAVRLGLTSFGGPMAHLGYFRSEYVVRRQWLDEATYADIVALCQSLPGPTSSEVGIAIGLLRAGPLGAFLAWLGFTLPSAVL